MPGGTGIGLNVHEIYGIWFSCYGDKFPGGWMFGLTTKTRSPSLTGERGWDGHLRQERFISFNLGILCGGWVCVLAREFRVCSANSASKAMTLATKVELSLYFIFCLDAAISKLELRNVAGFGQAESAVVDSAVSIAPGPHQTGWLRVELIVVGVGESLNLSGHFPG